MRMRSTTAALLAIAMLGLPAPLAARGGPQPVNPSFEAPDVSHWRGDVARIKTDAYHGGHALRVSDGTGTTLAGQDGPPIAVMLAVRGADEAGGVVRVVLVEESGARTPSAPIHLTPWWQTAGVTLAGASGAVELVVESEDGAAFLIDAVDVGPGGPANVTTSGRQLLVDGAPFTIKGYFYAPTPPEGSIQVLAWNQNPAQCQSDAQLMRASGLSTLRIWYQEIAYDATSYRQCLDAFHAAGVKLMWLIQPPGGLQTHVGRHYTVDGDRVDLPEAADPAYIEAYWAHLRTGVERLKDHPATLGWNIANEMSFTDRQSNGWFEQLDELAGRVKALDPVHVTTYSASANQFFGAAGPINPSTAPNIDLWGVNHYGLAIGFHDTLWGRIKAQDPTRPVWFSEFGVDRYRCAPPITLTSCGVAQGSGEDPISQAAWNAAQWDDVAANLSADDPDGAVVGGTLFMWSDLWWFAAVPVFTGAALPAIHDIGGAGPENPVTGEPQPFARDHFPDGHVTVEWFGVAHTLPRAESGPRVTTLAYEVAADRFTGTPGPKVLDVTLTVTGPCSAEVTWRTDVPTYGRADFGRDDKVIVGDEVFAENFVADRHVQSHVPATEHSATLAGLDPASPHKVYVRGFDGLGRPGGSLGVAFTTPTGLPPGCAGISVPA